MEKVEFQGEGGFPRILLGCPTHEAKEYCLEEYARGVRNLTYPNLEILMVDNSPDEHYARRLKARGLPVIRSKYFDRASRRIVCARNILRKRVLQGGFDYFFSLEQDVIPPPDVVERLLSHNKRIISAIVPSPGRTGDNLAMVYMRHSGARTETNDIGDFKESIHVYVMEEIEGKELIQVMACVLGCLLVHRSVLSRISFRFGSYPFDDLNFFFDCFRLGFPSYADCGVVCMHHKMNWEEKGIKI